MPGHQRSRSHSPGLTSPASSARPAMAQDPVAELQDTYGNEAVRALLAGQAPDASGQRAAEVGLTDGLHFFPGAAMLVNVQGGQVLAEVEARGGPEQEQQPRWQGEMPAGPTDSGDFLIARTEAYNTPSWAYSAIDWGTKLQDKGSDIWYQLPSGKYGSLARDYGIQRADVIAYHQRLYDQAIVPKTWVFNDFGPLAVRYFRDLNGAGKLDGNERLEGEMIHTTPQDEADTAQGRDVTLDESHGCIHLKPTDRDTLGGLGAFASGVAFKIHSYSESWTGR